MLKASATALTADRLLVELHVATRKTVLEQYLAVLNTAPIDFRICIWRRLRLEVGVFWTDQSVDSVPKMVVAFVAKPAPKLCTRPSSAPMTWRSPQLPRSWFTTS